MMGIIQEPLWGWSGNPAGGDTATTTTTKIPYNINTIQYFLNQLDIDIKLTWKIIQHEKRIQELQLTPENQYAKTREPGNASRNQKTRTGTNQEIKSTRSHAWFKKYLPMLLLTTAPSPSCWSLARTFLVTNLGVLKPVDWSDSDMIFLVWLVILLALAVVVGCNLKRKFRYIEALIYYEQSKILKENKSAFSCSCLWI